MGETEQIFPPSFYIKKEMQKRGLTQADMAVITGRYPSEVSNYLSKEKITPKFAKELSLILGNTPEIWLNLEGRYRLSLEEDLSEDVCKRNSFLQDYPLKEMQKRGWISNTDNFEELEPELRRLFEQTDNDQGLENTVLFKRTIKQQNLNAAERAWLYRARQLAKMLPVEPYIESRLDSLFSFLKRATKSSKAVHKVAELLQRYGIRFVVIEPLPNAKIDGAAFWLDDKSPVVALSLRFDNIGSFWFALLHELIHIKYRDNFSLDNLQDSPVNEIEERANREAAEFFVAKQDMEMFIRVTRPYYSKASINNLATKLQIHPGIIVGQLQKREEIGYNTHKESMAKVRELVTMTAFTDGWGHPVPIAK